MIDEKKKQNGMKAFFDRFSFADGAPFGILEEE